MGGGRVYVLEYIYSGWNENVIAKLSLLESKREFLYNIVLVSPCE